MSQKNEQLSKPRQPDEMVFKTKSEEERMVIDKTVELIKVVPCLKGLKVLQQKTMDDSRDEYCLLSVVNLSVKPTPKDSTLPWILSLTIGKGKLSSGHHKFYINNTYISTKFSEDCPYDNTRVLAKLAELNATLEPLMEIEEPKASAVLKEKYVATFFPIVPKRASPAAPTVIVQQAVAAEPPTKKAKVSAPHATKAEVSKKKAPAKRTTPRRNVPAKAPLPLKSKDEDSETAAKSDDEESESNQQENPEEKNDASFVGSQEGADNDDDDDGDK